MFLHVVLIMCKHVLIMCKQTNKLQIYIAQFPWRDDQLRITTMHGIK